MLMVKPGLRVSGRAGAAARADAAADRGVPGERRIRDDQVRRAGRALNEQRVVRETLGAFKRAGADLILSYFARDVIREGF